MHRQWREALRELGNALSPELVARTREIVAPHALTLDPAGCRVDRDIPYGPDARHRLDLFRPREGPPPSSIVMFVHGGGFVGGDKGSPESPFYDNFGAWAVREGFAGVTINYRLAPDHPWPAGAEDVGAAVDWLCDNASDIGVGPGGIVLTGESAGAAHVAGYLAGRSPKPRHPCVKGAVLMSGQYDVSGPLGPLESAYYGHGERDPAAQSTLAGLIDLDIPCMFAIAEYDAPQFQEQAALVVERWFAAKGALPNLFYIADGNHFSTSLGVGSEGDMLSAAMSAFIRKAVRI